MSENRQAKCASCETELALDHQGPCPACGGTARALSICVADTIPVSVEEAFEMKARDPRGFERVRTRGRTKISGKTKRRAYDLLSFDRSDPQFTRKIHRVEEIDEEGRREIVHDEDVRYPANRRPGKSKKEDETWPPDRGS